MTDRTIVLDSYALLAWLNEEPGHEYYRQFLEGSSWQRVITPVTLFELRLGLLKKGRPLDEQVAALAFVKTICETREVTELVALRAAEIKFKYLRLDSKKTAKATISMADALGISLAESLNCPLLSGARGLKQITEVPVLPAK